MSKTLARNSKLWVAKTYGAAVNMTAISNATEAVATLAAGHGVIVGDWLEVTSGWGSLSGRLLRVKTVASNDVTLEKCNTSGTVEFPVGSGTGTIRRVTAWDIASNLKNITSSGGDMQYADATTLDDFTEQKIPSVRSAQTVSVDYFDDPAMEWLATAEAAAATRIPTGFVLNLSNGAKVGGNAYFGITKVPLFNGANEALTGKLDMALAAEIVRYAS